MTKTERLVYDAIRDGDFNGDGCRHSQDLIAARIGRSREHVSRCCRSLERQGLLTITRPGRGRCNIYRVACWNPPLRSRVLAEIRVARRVLAQRRGAKCHTKGTAPTVEGPYVADTPFSRPSYETNNGLNPHRSTATGAPETRETCEGCLKAAEENAGLHEEIAGLSMTVRQQARQIGSLNRELTKAREDSPDAQLVKRTLIYWKRKLGKSDQVKITLTGERAKRVRWAIRQGYEADDLKAVVDGLKLYPFLVFGVRRASGAKDSRRDDIADAFKDEKSVEELIRLARRDVRRGEQMNVEDAA